MNTWPCDQIAADLLETERDIEKKLGVPCTLDIHTAEDLIHEAERLHMADFDGNVLEYVIERSEPHLNDAIREGYKRCLQKVFGRRVQWKGAQHELHGKNAPFAPL